MARRKSDDGGLTTDELRFLRSSAAAPAIREYVAQDGATVGVRTSAYRKVADAARAERAALMEVRLLDVMRVATDTGPSPDPQRVVALQAERRSLLQQMDALRRQVEHLTVGEAEAVSGEIER